MSGTRPLFIIWAALFALLALTVLASYVFTGPVGFAVSTTIAAAKAALIYWVYMHLREESGLVRLAAIGAMVWLMLLFALISTDYWWRPPM